MSDELMGDEVWWSCAMAAVQAMADTGRSFQCFDLTQEVGLVEPRSPKVWGRLMTAAHAAGIVRPVGAEESKRPTTARSLTRVWRGERKRAAA